MTDDRKVPAIKPLDMRYFNSAKFRRHLYAEFEGHGTRYMCRRLGVSRQTLINYFQEKNSPTLEIYCQMCAILGVELHEFIDLTDG